MKLKRIFLLMLRHRNCVTRCLYLYLKIRINAALFSNTENKLRDLLGRSGIHPRFTMIISTKRAPYFRLYRSRRVADFLRKKPDGNVKLVKYIDSAVFFAIIGATYHVLRLRQFQIIVKGECVEKQRKKEKENRHDKLTTRD